jgi:hypothetical protein
MNAPAAGGDDQQARTQGDPSCPAPISTAARRSKGQ